MRLMALAFMSVCIALGMTACGHSPSNTEKDAASDVRGEPINAPKPPPAVVQAVTKMQVAPSAEPKAIVQIEVKPIVTPPIETKAAEKVTTSVKAQAATGDMLTVGFDKLASYNFDIPDEAPLTNKTATVDKADEQIPANVKAFNQKK